MSLQTIIDKSSSIVIDKRKVTSSVLTRSGVLRTTAFLGHQPYFFTVNFSASLKYSTNRDLLEDLDRLDRVNEETIDIGTTNTNLSYITRYQGNASNASLSSITVNNVADFGNLYLNCSSVTGSTGFLFKKGDFIQPKGNSNVYRYTYQITNDILLSSAAGNGNVAVPVHRRLFEQPGQNYYGGGIKVGSQVTWPVKMLQKPNYTILPYDRVVFDGEFQLVEVMQDFVS
jgi:hypothetical protein